MADCKRLADLGLLYPNYPTLTVRIGTSGSCHCTKSLCDSGETRRVLSAILRGEIVGSAGGCCLEDQVVVDCHRT